MSSLPHHQCPTEAPSCAFAHSSHMIPPPPPQGHVYAPPGQGMPPFVAPHSGRHHQALSNAVHGIDQVNVYSNVSGSSYPLGQHTSAFVFPVHRQSQYMPRPPPQPVPCCWQTFARETALGVFSRRTDPANSISQLHACDRRASHGVHVGSHAPEISPVTVEPVTPPSDDDDDDTVIGSQTSSTSSSGSKSNQPAQDVFASVSDIPDDRLARTIALVLTDFCRSTSSEQPGFPEPHDPAALFFSPFRQKTFTLDFYCKRLLQYTYCSKSCFVVAILYLVRLSERFPVFELNDYNVHRLICTAVVLAAKFVDDTSFSNVHYAKVAGIQSPGEMNKLEAFMLKALDYRLFVSQESYREVEAQIAMIARECA